MRTNTNYNAGRSESSKQSQRQQILNLLIAGFRKKEPVPLPKIMAIAAQYNARILELRRMGWRIQNNAEHKDEKRHTWFSLLSAVPSTVLPKRKANGRTVSRAAMPHAKPAEQQTLLEMLPEHSARAWADPGG